MNQQISLSPTTTNNRDEYTVSNVLMQKHTKRWVPHTLCQNQTIFEAIPLMIGRGLSGVMIVDRETQINAMTHERGKVVGLMTEWDLLRRFASAADEGKNFNDIGEEVIGSFMTPLNKVIFGRLEETVSEATDIMAKVGVSCLPIMSKDGRVEGILTNNDINEFSLTAKDSGGKEAYLKNMAGRVGLPAASIMAEPPQHMKAVIDADSKPLYINIAIAALPHPFKTEQGVAMTRRHHGAMGYSNDSNLSEDAVFLEEAISPNGKPLTYAGVADGVGSWRQWGVDPRNFSRGLMRHCSEVIKEHQLSQIPDRSLTPNEILAEAHELVKMDDTVGSSTACMMVFDNVAHQLHFSNLGDSGIMILRRIDSNIEVEGAKVKKNKRSSDLQVAFVSQNQLLGFNHPFQFGWTGKELADDHTDSFKNASDCSSSSIHVRRGDIIIMATDGLFDNVDIDDITKLVCDWELEYGFIDEGDVGAREARWAKGFSKTEESNKAIKSLAHKIVHTARELSLNKEIDSPFAKLAKDNDIMWSGGMQDDTTIVIFHVVGEASKREGGFGGGSTFEELKHLEERNPKAAAKVEIVV